MKSKIVISTVCALLTAGHLIWPEIQIDLTTIILILVGVLPWLATVIRSLELPGGFKIELQDVKSATEKVASGSIATTSPPVGVKGREDNLDFLRLIAKTDPNLSLVGLRIEIERRLSALATDLRPDARRNSASVLLRELVGNQRIDRATASGLSDLIALGNQAAHGAEVSPSAAAWALDNAPLILEVLDSLIASNAPPKNRN